VTSTRCLIPNIPSTWIGVQKFCPTTNATIQSLRLGHRFRRRVWKEGFRKGVWRSRSLRPPKKVDIGQALAKKIRRRTGDENHGQRLDLRSPQRRPTPSTSSSITFSQHCRRYAPRRLTGVWSACKTAATRTLHYRVLHGPLAKWTSPPSTHRSAIAPTTLGTRRAAALQPASEQVLVAMSRGVEDCCTQFSTVAI